MISFDSEHLRLLWSMIETHSRMLEGLNDEAICFWLLKKIKDTIYLSPDEMDELKAYILSRGHLIRDIANSQGYSDNYSTAQSSNKTYHSKGVELPYDEAV
ncbi:MAG: hypothetical protein AAF572_12485 [Cyanobacteria bacterium P01_B01_bin.77]